MRAVVYHGPGQKTWEEVPDPVIDDDTDAIVCADGVTICTSSRVTSSQSPTVAFSAEVRHEPASMSYPSPTQTGENPGYFVVGMGVARAALKPPSSSATVAKPEARRSDAAVAER